MRTQEIDKALSGLGMYETLVIGKDWSQTRKVLWKRTFTTSAEKADYTGVLSDLTKEEIDYARKKGIKQK